MDISTRQPYGTWRSPLEPHLLASDVSFQDVQWDSDGRTLVWLESRSGTGVLVCRKEGAAGHRDLTRKISARATVGYGGGEFAVSQGTVYFVNEKDIYSQQVESTQCRLIANVGVTVAAPSPSPDGRWLLFIASTPKKDSIRLIDSDGRMEPPVLVHESDFCMQPAWHPDGRRVAWVTWTHPNMPWQESSVCLAKLDLSSSSPCAIEKVDLNSELGFSGGSFQPCFSPDGKYLSFVSDHQGWFNLQVVELARMQIVASAEEPAEHAPPAWIQGMRSQAWAANSRQIYFLRSRKGNTHLALFDLEKQIVSAVPGLEGYSTARQLSFSPVDSRAALIVSSHNTPPRIVTMDCNGTVPKTGSKIERRSSSELTRAEFHTEPEHLSWGSGTTTSFGLYYRPSNPGFSWEGPPPVIIKIHGGPTSEYTAGYDSDTLFFTTRGYAVLALNYRGSSGFGRAYRDSLKENWGLSDVADVRSAADFLVAERRADAERLVVMGGSAGGFTVLNSLIRYPGFFLAGICRYGVSDLFALARETHKLEAHYHLFLVGDPEEHADRYRDRSPALHADRIQDPVALFQGTDDKVVPRTHSDAIANSLKSRTVPHVYRVFEGEGHGWRKAETVAEYYQLVDDFLRSFVVPVDSEPLKH
jgi:dipeptidyl aminopeptidase/acylaminoacyl peptidase